MLSGRWGAQRWRVQPQGYIRWEVRGVRERGAQVALGFWLGPLEEW